VLVEWRRSISSVLCTDHPRRRFMFKLVAFAVLFSVVALAPAPFVAAGETISASTHVGDDKININTADVKDLMKLHGIHHNLAEKIVKYRDEHGLFKKPEDLRKVDGVGGGLWEKNRDRIVVQ
jgi:competence protein ComEA